MGKHLLKLLSISKFTETNNKKTSGIKILEGGTVDTSCLKASSHQVQKIRAF